MKKSLLLTLASMAALTAGAAEPTMYFDSYANGISNNGRYAVSYMYGITEIIDLTTGEGVMVSTDDEAVTGSGNKISDTGILVGSIGEMAAWAKGGEFEVLNEEVYNLGSSYANAITPDGTRIVGIRLNSDMDLMASDVTMQVPCYWDVKADGTVGEVVDLPHPELDFSGRAPQYITATSVSADGKVIVGNITDCSGYLKYPILYTQSESGEWTYSLPAEKYLNPNHVEFPSLLPEPAWVNYENFMTPSELAAYQAALDEYYETWTGDYPDFRDFMSAGELAAYNKAMAAYEEANEAYLESLFAFQDALNEAVDASVQFVFNNIYLSTDGKTITAGAEEPGGNFFNPADKYVTVIDIATGELKRSPEGYNILPTTIAANGTIVASKPLSMFGGDPVQSYVIMPGSETPITLKEFFAIANPDLAAWMDENLQREYLAFDPETYEEYPVDYMFSGYAVFSQDMTSFISGVIALWEGYEEEVSDFFSYYSTGLTSGLKGVSIASKEALSVSGEKGGVIRVNGVADTVSVYDLSGREVFSAKAAATLSTGLPSGFYVVKATGAAGTTTTKVTF